MEVDPRLAANYRALSRGDLDTWLAGLDDEAVLYELAEMPDTAVYRGHEEIRRWAEEGRSLLADWEWIPEEVLHTSEGLIVVRVRLTGKGHGSGAPIEQTVFHVIELRDGKATALHGFLSERDAMAAAHSAG